MNRQILISQIEEVGADIGEPDCRLVKPFLVTTSAEKITMAEGVIALAPFMMGLTSDDTFMISSDKILTLAEPKKSLLKKYEDLTKE